MKRRIAICALVVVGAAICVCATSVQAEAPTCQSKDAFCYAPAAHALIETVISVSEPPVAVPSWLGVAP